MPQLNPTPWFMTFIMTWATFAVLMNLTLTSAPLPQPALTHKAPLAPHWPWTWQ
uniref:ATP synthase complex subunit 8 n=1 Tax=Cyrtodactylus peguensis TaxID=752001 RepID=A0A343W7I5_9SAUR|nr:ATP synthase F0 subunit 8 [Cyrtodactylus peguensis]BBD20464.1 ATP synthase F0 subunit 8 [Cyrtodactylus peguensis]